MPQELTVLRVQPVANTGGPYKVLIGQSLSLNGSGSLPLDGSTLTAYAVESKLTIGGSVATPPTRTTANVRIAGTLGGAGGLIKNGPGVLWLEGAASYDGATTVNAGQLDFSTINLGVFGGGSGRNISVAEGAAVRRNSLDNAFLNRLVETTAEITVMTAATSNNLNFAGSTGANLPNAFLGNWASNGAKAEYSGTLTPANDAYRLGGTGSSGFLGIVGTNRLTGPQGLIVGGTSASSIRVMLAGANDFSGDTVINNGARLTLGHNLAMQNSVLDVGSTGGNFALNNTGTITGAVVTSSPTLGGLKGSRNLLSVFTNASGNNESNVDAALSVASGATLGGTGTIGRDVTIAASGKLEFAISTAAASHARLNISTGRSFGFSGTSSSFTAGVLTGVSATPTVAGNNLTFTVNDGSGHTGSTTIATIQTQYAAWAGGAAFDADENEDGVKNGLAWALGAADPTADATGLLPVFDNASDPTYFIFTYRRSDAANASASIEAQYGGDLSTWATASTGPNIITQSDDFYAPGVDRVEIKINRTLAAGGKLFVRLKVVASTP